MASTSQDLNEIIALLYHDSFSGLPEIGMEPAAGSPASVLTHHNNEGSPRPRSPPESDSPRIRSPWAELHTQLRARPIDADGWLRLVDLAERSEEIEKIKDTYDCLLEAYPSIPSVQYAYLRHFLDDPSHWDYAEQLFKTFLQRGVPSVDIVKLYLRHIRRKTLGQTARDVLIKCYKYALDIVGSDYDSYEIWEGYIQFLKSREASTASSWKDGDNENAIRRAYHQALQTPMENLKSLWNDYRSFEDNCATVSDENVISQLHEKYMRARQAFSKLCGYSNMFFPPVTDSSNQRQAIYLPSPPVFTHNDKALVTSWRHYLKWEEGNPLEIEERDRSAFVNRVQRAYRKATVRMRFYPEIWYMAYTWMNSVGKTEEALELLEAGYVANTASFVLNFAYADALEVGEKHTEVYTLYATFLKKLHQDLEDLENRARPLNSDPSAIPNDIQKQEQRHDANASSRTQTLNPSSSSNETSREKASRLKEFNDRRVEYRIVWIAYIRFARRADGISSARDIFKKARAARWVPWEVYEVAALIEYHHATENLPLATKIFEDALKLYGDDVEFVVHYLSFLVSVHDQKSAAELVDRVGQNFSADEARPLWAHWARYLYQYGDLTAIHALEQRMAVIYPADPPIRRFAERYKFGHIDLIATRDLGFAPGGSSLSGSDTAKPTIFNTSANPSTSKRVASPDSRHHHESHHDYYPPKRARTLSIQASPRVYDPNYRDRSQTEWAREGGYQSRGVLKEGRKEDAPVKLHDVLSQFIEVLPPPSAVDSDHIISTSDLMRALRDAIIPSSSRQTQCTSASSFT